jgi:hypothetical protein
MARRRRNRKSKNNSESNKTQLGGGTMTVGGNRIPKSISNPYPYRCTLRALYTGGNVTPATTAGYGWITITSSSWSSSSGYSQLAALFMRVKPIQCRAIITFNRATGTSDNPRVAFIPTPDGQVVGNLGMNLSTFESPLGCVYTGGPGAQIGYKFKPYVSIAAYNTVSNGYLVQPAPQCSIRSIPLIYYGDVLFYTPGAVLTTVTQYVSIAVEFDFEFSYLRTDLVA